MTIWEAGLGDLFMLIKQQWALKKTTPIHLSWMPETQPEIMKVED